MKPVNLIALSQGFETVPKELLPSFEAQLVERDEPLDAVKVHEAQSVIRLVDVLMEQGADSHHFEGFVFSFRIPQISSEFDLLKVTDSAVVNIELKIEDVGIDRIEHQLARNRYYLAPLERTIHTFTFIANEDAFFEMDDEGQLKRVDAKTLLNVLGALGRPYEGRVEDLFTVSNYLVSPLNDTDRFLNGSYFLTNHQAQIKASFLKACELADDQQDVAFLVYGSAGTGKSLLLYDLAKSLEVSRPVCVVHCGVLSEGHEKLNERQSHFRVVSAKGIEHIDLQSYGAFLVDEAHRLWPSQLKRIAEVAFAQKSPLYLSLGRRQALFESNMNQNAEQIVEELFSHVSVYELSRKIRTNRELANFIRALFDIPGYPKTCSTRCVKVCAADGPQGAQLLVETYRREGYQFIAYTGQTNGEVSLDEIDALGCPNASAVIGQEFDKVVMVVGKKFFPDGDTFYRQLLFQGLTRARSQIALIVLDSDALLAKLLGILQGSANEA